MMKRFGVLGLVVVIVVGALLIFSAAFTMREGEQVLITQFGKIIGKPITKAGLHWKIPFIQDVRNFEKRMLEWDGDPNQIPTKDKKYIWVDTTARWRISDAVLFAETVRSERGAHERLDSILDGATRDIISKHNLVEAVRDTNAILEKRKQRKEQLKKAGETDLEVIEIEEEASGEIKRILVGREKISAMIIQRAREKLGPLGIDLIDVQLRRIAYESSVEKKVYDRMISERNRIAEKIRSIGKGEQAKIQGKLNRDLKKIESQAYRKSQEIRGKADAIAVTVYARVLGKDPSFYDFVRTLQAYEKTIPKGTFILSTDSEFLQLLKKRTRKN